VRESLYSFWNLPRIVNINGAAVVDSTAYGWGFTIAALLAMTSSRLGLWIGNWMARVRR